MRKRRSAGLSVPSRGRRARRAERITPGCCTRSGNDHAGTYYPVVLSVVPFLAEILREGEETARLITLDVLLDLLASFHPEPAFENVGIGGVSRRLRDVLAERALSLRADVERLLASPPHAKLAAELLVVLGAADEPATGR
jgi:hypothetical protein